MGLMDGDELAEDDLGGMESCTSAQQATRQPRGMSVNKRGRAGLANVDSRFSDVSQIAAGVGTKTEGYIRNSGMQGGVGIGLMR
jgi:hypothetical protein